VSASGRSSPSLFSLRCAARVPPEGSASCSRPHSSLAGPTVGEKHSLHAPSWVAGLTGAHAGPPSAQTAGPGFKERQEDVRGNAHGAVDLL